MNVLIVLNYNDYDTTCSLISRAETFQSINKIIVVDNCSTDNSLIKLRKIVSEKIDVISTDENNGYASGNNFGAYYAITKYLPQYLIIANPDIIFDEELVLKMQEIFSGYNKVGIVSGKMNCKSEIQLQIAWKRPSYTDCLLENLILLKRILGERNIYDYNYFQEDVVEVEVLPGSFFMIEATVFENIGGFDEETFLYYEENILSHKLRRSNYVNYLITTKEYVHNHSVSINKSISSVKRRLEICQNSREIYCKKYLKINTIKMIFLRLTFKIGLFDYLLAKKIIGRMRCIR